MKSRCSQSYIYNCMQYVPLMCWQFTVGIVNNIFYLVLVWKFVFSSPELKAQVSFTDRLLSVWRLSVRHFFFRTAWPISTKVGTNHPYAKRIQNCTNEAHPPSPRGDNSERVKIYWTFFKNLLLQKKQASFNKTWYKSSLGKGNSKLYKSRARSFSKGR
jgi:hypothetical protein